MNQTKARDEIKKIIKEAGLLNTLRGLYDVVKEISGSRTLAARAIKKSLISYETWYWKNKR